MKQFIIIIFCSVFLMFNQLSLKAQDDKIVTITVSGQGKTQDDAKQSALRNAIEQAFGAFISANTQILNDELVKDEIVSVSNGNIQEFKILSEVQATDGFWNNTVQAKVSVSKLTTFCESKGISVEFKGGLFSINIKQQLLNEENEIKAIDNMCKVLKEISNQSFDFEIKASDPSTINLVDGYENIYSGDVSKSWKIPITVSVKINNNFKNISSYLSNTLNGISLNNQEIENYLKLQKPIYTIAIIPVENEKGATINNLIYYFRKEESLYAILDFIFYFKNSLINFQITNNVDTIKGTDIFHRKQLIKFHIDDDIRTYNMKLGDCIWVDLNFKPILFGYRFYGLFNTPEKWDFHLRTKLYSPIIVGSIVHSEIFLNGLEVKEQIWKSYKKKICPSLNSQNSYTGRYDLIISFSNLKSGLTASTLSFYDIKSLENLSKITEYKISQISK